MLPSGKKQKNSSWNQSLDALKSTINRTRQHFSSLSTILSLANINQICSGSKICQLPIFTNKFSRSTQANQTLKSFSAIKWSKDFGKVQVSNKVKRSWTWDYSSTNTTFTKSKNWLISSLKSTKLSASTFFNENAM